ncbi:TIGR01244 family protein [Shimia gijangensis]|uniref:TIGR01244 family protein n=1 Tax=Shimia gijangensis TaxID=1470563 RepID=A0A1M6E1S3_9RHOB|nr:TIGR01244 family sulfur transferase [Shimia gijangensis]SHI79452.1 TIGR01244 family protein [Shimia gijangensis]
MQLRQVTPRYFVSPQISPEDVAGLAEAGFTHVICNRPDAEVPASHQADAVGAAVKAAGLEFVVNPLTHDTMTSDRLGLQRETLENASGKVLAYCASGTRSTVAWSLAHVVDLGADSVLDSAAAAGYDLAGLRPSLQALVEKG